MALYNLEKSYLTDMDDFFTYFLPLYYESPYTEGEYSEHVANSQFETAAYYFPTLKEDGGTLDSLEELKEILEKHPDVAREIAECMLRQGKLSDKFREDFVNVVKKHVLSAMKVYPQSFYKKLLEINNWNEPT